MRVLGYTRVSTDEQHAGLLAQSEAINAEVKRRDWTYMIQERDNGFSAKDLNRPGIQNALETLRKGDADVLMVSKLDRLSRSMLDFSTLMEQARKEGWAIIALDVGVDMTTPAGEMLANVLATFAQFERRLIGQRTKEALAQKKANGVKLGRPRQLDQQIRDYITWQHSRGYSYSAIAEILNVSNTPTAHGGKKWWPETVRGIVQSEGG
jgi:DNA invertase Pin-like site-specific DNA recombinase